MNIKGSDIGVIFAYKIDCRDFDEFVKTSLTLGILYIIAISFNPLSWTHCDIFIRVLFKGCS